MTSRCQFIVKKGPRAGQICGKSIKNPYQCCSNHQNRSGFITESPNKTRIKKKNWFYDVLPIDLQDYILKIPYVDDILISQQCLDLFEPLEILRVNFLKLNEIYNVNKPFDEIKLTNHFCNWFSVRVRELIKMIWKKYDSLGRHNMWHHWFIDFNDSFDELYGEKGLQMISPERLLTSEELYELELDDLISRQMMYNKASRTYLSVADEITRCRPLENVSFDQVISSLVTIFIERHGILIERCCKEKGCGIVTKNKSGYCPYHNSPSTRTPDWNTTRY